MLLATWTKPTGGAPEDSSGLDLSTLKIDLSGSTVDIDSLGGYLQTTFYLDNGQSVTQSFSYDIQSKVLSFSNPLLLESFYLQHEAQIEHIETEIPDIPITSHEGPNLFVAEVELSNNVLAGTSGSWYVDGGGCEGVFPDPQLCQ